MSSIKVDFILPHFTIYDVKNISCDVGKHFRLATSGEATWFASNDKILSVQDKCMYANIHALKTGVSEIIVRVGRKEKSVFITVREPVAVRFKFTAGEPESKSKSL